jgi:hypothetical protein
MVRKKDLAAVQSWSQPRQSEYYSKILNTIWQLKKQGYAEGTLKAYDSRLRMLAKHVSLDIPDAVKAFLSRFLDQPPISFVKIS